MGRLDFSMMKIRTLYCSILLGVFFGAVAGCVRTMEHPEPLARSSLVITRTGSTATLSWQSDPYISYTVMQKDRRNSRSMFEPLAGAINMLGTGDTMQVEDHAPPREDRKYRLHMVPLPKPGTRKSRQR